MKTQHHSQVASGPFSNVEECTVFSAVSALNHKKVGETEGCVLSVIQNNHENQTLPSGLSVAVVQSSAAG